MGKLVKGINNGMINQFQPGESGNINGRPKKFVTTLKENGYKLSEVNDTIQAMMAMTIDELKQVFDNSQSTILEKTVAGAMVKSLKNGSLYSLGTLMTRVYGKPKETATIESNGKIEVVFVKGKTIL